jgi:hypothetical protein
MKKLLILAFLFGIKQVNAQICFGEATTYATGSGAASIVYTDFNADGNKDFAVSNNGSGDISILLGTGTGTFGAATSVGVGTGPYTLATADFNGDGKADLAVANHGSNDVSVLLGNGSGGFAVATSFAVGTGPISLTSADFNADGFKDIATANFNSNNVSVLLGDGAGSFGTATSFSVGAASSTPNPHSIVSGDFNGDGKADLATANYSTNKASILLGTGTGSFGASTDFTTGTGASLAPYCIITTDFNGDGKADLATSNSSTSTSPSTISVLLGTGTGTFGSAVSTGLSIGSAPGGLTSGDFNGDTKIDIAVGNVAVDNVYVLLGTGTGGTFTTGGIFSLTPGSAPNAIIATDLNGDGKLDLGVANWGADNVAVLLSAALPIVTASAYATTICSGQSDTLRGGGAASYVWAGTPSGYVNGAGFVVTTTKTYSLTGTDTNGCTNKATITITVNPLPTLTVTATSSVVCFGQTTTLNASGASTYTWNTGATGSSAAVTPVANTVYTVTGTNANGCKNTKTYSVTITPVITIYGSNKVCIGDSSLLFAYGANTYTWSAGNVMNDSLYIHPTSTVTPTTYSVIGTDTATGCNSTVSYTVIAINDWTCHVGINQNNYAAAFTVYPNPSNGSFVVETNTNIAQLMQVFDVNGKMVLSQTITGRSTIDAAGLNEGIYSVKVSGTQGVVNKKLVIVK